MKPFDSDDIIHGYLDGTLTDEQLAALNAWVKADPENATLFAEWIKIDDRLGNEIRAAKAVRSATLNGLDVVAQSEQASRAPTRWYLPKALLSSLAAALVIVAVAWSIWPFPATAASELDQLIQAPTSGLDRVYKIISLDADPRPVEPRQAPVDNADLFVRHPDQFVLVRYFPDGRKYVTGSDGDRNWDVPPSGAVRLSRDPWRFRWPLPGHQYGLPFVDLRSDLVQLRDSYSVVKLPTRGNGWKGLAALKKSHLNPGPKRIELWYDGATSEIHEMIFQGLPQSRGGPRSVAIQLREQKDLGKGFFQHEKHHEPGRRVIDED